MLETLDKAAVSYQIVLTKADQVKPAELEERDRRRRRRRSAKRPAAFPQIIATSSRDGDGMPELRAAIARLLRRNARA